MVADRWPEISLYDGVSKIYLHYYPFSAFRDELLHFLGVGTGDMSGTVVSLLKPSKVSVV